MPMQLILFSIENYLDGPIFRVLPQSAQFSVGPTSFKMAVNAICVKIISPMLLILISLKNYPIEPIWRST